MFPPAFQILFFCGCWVNWICLEVCLTFVREKNNPSINGEVVPRARRSQVSRCIIEGAIAKCKASTRSEYCPSEESWQNGKAVKARSEYTTAKGVVTSSFATAKGVAPLYSCHSTQRKVRPPHHLPQQNVWPRKKLPQQKVWPRNVFKPAPSKSRPAMMKVYSAS